MKLALRLGLSLVAHTACISFGDLQVECTEDDDAQCVEPEICNPILGVCEVPECNVALDCQLDASFGATCDGTLGSCPDQTRCAAHIGEGRCVVPVDDPAACDAEGEVLAVAQALDDEGDLSVCVDPELTCTEHRCEGA